MDEGEQVGVEDDFGLLFEEALVKAPDIHEGDRLQDLFNERDSGSFDPDYDLRTSA